MWKVEEEWLTANCVVILHFSMENINSMFRIRRVRSLEVIQVCWCKCSLSVRGCTLSCQDLLQVMEIDIHGKCRTWQGGNMQAHGASD